MTKIFPFGFNQMPEGGTLVSLSVFSLLQGNEASYALDMCSHCKYQ